MPATPLPVPTGTVIQNASVKEAENITIVLDGQEFVLSGRAAENLYYALEDHV